MDMFEYLLEHVDHVIEVDEGIVDGHHLSTLLQGGPAQYQLFIIPKVKKIGNSSLIFNSF
jgi:hypothetical protein